MLIGKAKKLVWFMKKYVVMVSLLMCVSCSNGPDKNDPNEEFNRNMFEFNMDFDDQVLRPVASGYKTITPDPMQEIISNVLSNFKEPYYGINYLLKGDAEQFATSLFRFVINSTIGFFGVIDVAKDVMDLLNRKTDYRETLHAYKVPMGDYLVIPFLSSSYRDIVAEPVSWFMDPFCYILGFPVMAGKFVLGVISSRAENMRALDNIKKDSVDPYSTAKSVYVQQYGDEDEEDEED